MVTREFGTVDTVVEEKLRPGLEESFKERLFEFDSPGCMVRLGLFFTIIPSFILDCNVSIRGDVITGADTFGDALVPIP